MISKNDIKQAIRHNFYIVFPGKSVSTIVHVCIQLYMYVRLLFHCLCLCINYQYSRCTVNYKLAVQHIYGQTNAHSHRITDEVII